MVGERYGLDPASLRVFDAIVIRYDSADGQDVRLPVHRDVSLISLNLALTSPGVDFDQGGTFFEGFYDDALELRDDGAAVAAADVAKRLELPRGHALCHPSGLRHGAHRITRGERMVMIVFILKEDVPHTARRASDLAHAYQSRGDLETAAAIWQGALELDPADHELIYGLAHVLEEMGRTREARAEYLDAAAAYPLCPKPHLALGALLMGAGRPRAALRRFERALALTPDPKDDDAWTAAVHALSLIHI